MPISQGSAGGLPGLNLKAWVLVSAAGAVVKSSGVSSVVKGGAGQLTVNFSAPMASTNYLAKFTQGASATGDIKGSINSLTVNSAMCATVAGASANDVGGLWEFYE